MGMWSGLFFGESGDAAVVPVSAGQIGVFKIFAESSAAGVNV